MSRQRIRSSVLESSTEKCPVCGGSGHVRSVSSVALQCLRALEEMLLKGATHNLIVRTRAEVALYMLNHKRAHLRELEERFRVTLTVSADATVNGQQSYAIDRGEQVHSVEAAKSLADAVRAEMPLEEPAEAEETEAVALSADEANAETEQGDARGDGGRRRRRRRGRGGRGRGGEPREAGFTPETVAEHAVAHEDHDAGTPEEFAGEPAEAQPMADEAGEPREGPQRRRRGRRGGRRNRRSRETPGAGNGHGSEHEVHAGTDFPPVSEEDADAMAPPFEQAPRSEPLQAAAPAERAPAPQETREEAEARRRGSTVREPAQFGGEAAPPANLPPPTPVVSSTGDETAAPKRGWWAKRLIGGKD